MDVTLKLFATISSGMEFHADTIHSHICGSEGFFKRPVGVISIELHLHSRYNRRRYVLNGRLTDTSSGCNMPVILPGITTISQFSCRNFIKACLLSIAKISEKYFFPKLFSQNVVRLIHAHA
ncbi:hypothetical protein C0J52_11099 [Blattella germanica]|nr:hypothetical protein C0J52_11099 [Blattella germanica]